MQIYFAPIITSAPIITAPIITSAHIPSIKALAKSDLLLLRLTAAVSARDATIQKRILGFCLTTLIISNKEMGDIMKIVKSLKECSLLIQGVGGIIKNKAKKQKVEFLACY